MTRSMGRASVVLWAPTSEGSSTGAVTFAPAAGAGQGIAALGVDRDSPGARTVACTAHGGWGPVASGCDSMAVALGIGGWTVIVVWPDK